MTAPAERLSAALIDRYTIERELGAGGMATVYLAHDIKHDRDVAIKVLHPDLGAALGADRFLSEIRTTARLQHPHILPLLDSGDANGLLYYVMPVVTGETLRARLTREQQLPIPEAVRIAREVASALDYAHRQGVIHRDIKPENILLHDGQALVADFGIALAVQTAGGTRMTQTGLSLGTPQYMSPEQAMGEKQIDARTDVYALGAVTYEMLVGEPPFTGATVQAIVAKVMTERPTAPHAIRDTVPPGVEHAILTALAKLPADRFATAAEFSTALANPSGAGTAAFAAPRRPLHRNRPAMALGALALLAGVVAAWGWMRKSEEPTVPPLIKVVIPSPAKVSIALVAGVSVSPDGSMFAFIGQDSTRIPELYVRSLADLTAEPLLVAPVTSQAAFSWTGDAVAYIRSQELLTVGLRGGSPHRVAPITDPRGLDWGEDSTFVAGSGDVLLHVSLNGERIDTIAKPDATGISYRTPSFATRDLILFEMYDKGGTSRLAALSLANRRPVQLGITGMHPTLVDGHTLVYFQSDGTIWGVEFNPRNLKVSGTPRQISDNIAVSRAGRALAGVARNGTLVYRSGGPANLRELVLVDRTGRARNIGGPSRPYRYPRYSPNGKRLAVTMEGRSGFTTGDIWVLDATGSGLTRVTTDSDSYHAEWERDGLNLTYVRRAQTGGSGLWRVPSDGSGRPAQILARSFPIYEHQVTPDHRTIIWREDSSGLDRNVLSAPLDSPRVVHPILNSTFDEKGIALSPDGGWLAYVSNETGTNEVYIRRLEPNSPRKPLSLHGGTEPRWCRSGEVFFRSGDTVMVSHVTLGSVPRSTPPTALFAGVYAGVGYEPMWDVSPDCREFAMVRSPGAAQSQFMLVANWTAHWNKSPR